MSEPTLPPGWTEERLRNAVPDDYDGLPGDVLDRLIAYTRTPAYIAALAASQAAESQSFKTSQRARYNAERASLGLPPRPVTPPETRAAGASGSQLVETVVKQGFHDDWGFLLFRTDYSDDNAWARYEAGFKRVIDKSVVDDGAECVQDGCMVKMVDDEDLEGAAAEVVRQHFHALKEAGEVPPGLDVAMCLIVDKATIASVTEGQFTPYVVAVDVEHVEGDENNEEGYKGYFKVAISSLLPDLYPPLGSHSMRPDELWPFARPIFMSAYGNDD